MPIATALRKKAQPTGLYRIVYFKAGPAYPNWGGYISKSHWGRFNWGLKKTISVSVISRNMQVRPWKEENVYLTTGL